MSTERKADPTFDEQVALVTGAGSAQGIGFAVARRFYAVGAQVAITSTTPRIHERAREIDSSGQRILAIQEDLTNEAAAQRLVESVFQRFGRIDILVNNAGMSQIDRPLESKSLQHTSYADWRRQIDITLHTAFLMTRAVLPCHDCSQVRTHCERIVGDRSVGEQSRIGRLWRGKGGDG